jgi:hypothetical protein
VCFIASEKNRKNCSHFGKITSAQGDQNCENGDLVPFQARQPVVFVAAVNVADLPQMFQSKFLILSDFGN